MGTSMDNTFSSSYSSPLLPNPNSSSATDAFLEIMKIIYRIRSALSTISFGKKYISLDEFKRNYLYEYTKYLYTTGHDIYSISKVLGVTENRIRRILCELYLKDEISLKYRPVPRILEEMILALHDRGYSQQDIKRVVQESFPQHIVRQLDLIGTSTVLMKYNRIPMSDSFRKLLEKYGETLDVTNCGEVYKYIHGLGLKPHYTYRLYYLTERVCRESRSDYEKIMIEPNEKKHIRSNLALAVLKLYNSGHSIDSISTLLYVDHNIVSRIIESLRNRNFKVLIEVVRGESIITDQDQRAQMVSANVNNYESIMLKERVMRQLRFKLSFLGFGRKNIVKKFISLKNCPPILHFLSKADAIKYILEEVFPTLEKNGYFIEGNVKYSITYWLKNNGFGSDEIRQIYNAWKRMRKTIMGK